MELKPLSNGAVYEKSGWFQYRMILDDAYRMVNILLVKR